MHLVQLPLCVLLSIRSGALPLHLAILDNFSSLVLLVLLQFINFTILADPLGSTLTASTPKRAFPYFIFNKGVFKDVSNTSGTGNSVASCNLIRVCL